MDVLECIRSRTSYRGAYQSTPVPRADLVKILEAGACAPSGCNRQTASFIAVDDSVLLQEIKALIDPPVAETAAGDAVPLSMLTNQQKEKFPSSPHPQPPPQGGGYNRRGLRPLHPAHLR